MLKRYASLVAVLLILAGGAFAQTQLGTMFRLGYTTTAGRPASSATVEGALLYDTDVNAPIVNNGSSWSTLGGGGGGTAYRDIAVYVNQALVASTEYGGEVMPARSTDVAAVRYRIRTAGSGGSTNTTFRISDGTNNCDCAFACNSAAGNYRTTCSGTCSFAASASMTYSVTSIGNCTTGPDLGGNLIIEGTYP